MGSPRRDVSLNEHQCREHDNAGTRGEQSRSGGSVDHPEDYLPHHRHTDKHDQQQRTESTPGPCEQRLGTLVTDPQLTRH